MERLFALETFGIKLGLENITRLCEALDHPERSFKAIHVAGTNGKGSVTAMVHAALVAAGLKAARYTSPHLVDVRERFVIGRDMVDEASFHEVATSVLDEADRLVTSGALPGPPTFFEATTAIAFELFRRARIEVAVVEVGLGGRFDATNVLSPKLGAITSIGLDHQQYLGDSIAQIAFEKAGIIKPGMLAIVGKLPHEAEAVVRQVAFERGALLSVGDQIAIGSRMHEGRAIIVVRTPRRLYGPVRLALRGGHQVDNAVLALRILEWGIFAEVDVPGNAIERGLSEAEWPARLELIAIENDRRVLIDAAHNPDGAASLARYLDKWHPERPPLVFAAMRDKDIDGILRALLPFVGPIVVTRPETHRAESPSTLAARVHAVDPTRAVHVEDDPLAAVNRALTIAPTVCVAGSIFLAGAVRDGLQRRAILP